jgi:hypothetical protein
MIVRWANPSQTYFILEEDDGSVYTIPTDERHPDWARIQAMIEAGTLTIPDYEPPISSELEG